MAEAVSPTTSEKPKAPRIGVFVCHCGTNIAGSIDIDAVKEYAKTLPNVAVVDDYKYMCSMPGQGTIKDEITEQNLTGVVVARQDDKAISLAGFLVDTYCLGAKNAVPPTTLDQYDMPYFVADFFSAYSDPPMRAPIDLARNLVFGAVDFARRLGFDPHQDYYSAVGHLGAWEPPGRITFGRDGRPFFIQGPHDNAGRIMRILDRSVGAGNYEFTVVAGV